MAKSKKKVPGINGSSMADISFILLIFFLITTSMDTDKGIKRRLPPLVPKEEQHDDIEINDRNIMQLLVNRKDQIAVLRKTAGGESTQLISIEDLKERVKEFVVNPHNSPELPEKETREIPGLGMVETTTLSYAISLKNEVETSYQMFINVQNEILKAYNEIWDEYARMKFNTPYEELSTDKQKMVLDVYPMHLSEMPLSNLK